MIRNASNRSVADAAGACVYVNEQWVEIVGVPAQQQTTGTRVIPLDAANSVLYLRIIDTAPAGFRMPFDGPPFLSPREENIMKTWIDMGAGNN